MRRFLWMAIIGSCVVALGVVTDISSAPAAASENPLRDQAAEALRRACGFFRNEVAVEGSYLWRYSDDLSRREGEGKASATTAWVQPPGTPTVGMAYLAAFGATGEAFYLDAARETAMALVRGQLRSGGWDYRIEFSPETRRRYAYRDDVDAASDARNLSTLDDDTTQAALRFLIQVDQALELEDDAIHEAVAYGLDCLLKAQYPNGAWPQRFDAFPDPSQFPVKRASYPVSWPREHPSRRYYTHYTLNDNTLSDMIRTMLLAARIYDEPRYRQAAERGGDFLILAQMPEPQPAWAQQYDLQMHPAWARKFEPPAVTGGESQGSMRVLMALYRETGQQKFLEPLPRAIAYFRRSTLDDGRLARFYELETNRPLYFTRDYQLTYSDDDMPTHYGFKSGNQIEAIAAQYQRFRDAEWRPPESFKLTGLGPSPMAEETTKAAIAALDAEGRWVETGRLKYHGPDDPTRRIIASATFVRNVQVLCNYLRITPRTFQGRTADQWSERLKDEDRLVRLSAIKALGALVAVPELIDASEANDAAVRYWALVELRHAGPQAKAALAHFRKRLSDPSPIVRVAAAGGMCDLGQIEEGLSVLAQLLGHPQETIRLAAVTVLEKIGPAARPVRDELEAALSDSSKYVVRVAARTLRRLDHDAANN